MTEIEMTSRDIARFRTVVGQEAIDRVRSLARATESHLDGRVLWNVNSTAAGGGVAEMLQALLPYARGAGIDTRWVVLHADAEFFAVTKRLHHALHGSRGDGSPLDDRAHAVYDRVTAENAATYVPTVRSGDVVILHDPQTAGLARFLIDAGALVIWRCHIGQDTRDVEVERGWQFLARYLREVPSFVFTRETYVPDYCDHGKSTIITPSLDAFSPKNQDMSDEAAWAILTAAGVVDGNLDADKACFTREDGTLARVDLRATVVREGPLLSWQTPLVVQVSRWDPLKDPVGVMHGFAHALQGGETCGAALVLAGPDATAVADDPEGAAVYGEVVSQWKQLPPALRRRIHLLSLPMTDVQQNAAIVNALQRHATIVVQKSLREGFGLTVTEAMWKARPVVATAVGGILDQIVDAEHGLLLGDPHDLRGLAEKLQRLLSDPALARRLGDNARRRVTERYLGIQHLAKYANLIEQLIRMRLRAGNPRRFTAAHRSLAALDVIPVPRSA